MITLYESSVKVLLALAENDKQRLEILREYGLIE